VTKLNNKFETGQVWSCRSVSSNNEHKALIVSIDEFEDENVIGIAVISQDSGGSPFMPFSIKSFSASAFELIDTGRETSDFNDGYQYWKELYIDGEAGVYDISIDEVLGLNDG